MKCNICKKEIPQTNCNWVIYNNESILVCGKHYVQLRKYGKFLDSSPKTVFDSNEFKTEGDITYVYTTTKSNEVSGYFIIDTEDLDKVIVRKWRLWKDKFYTGVEKPTTIWDFLLKDKKEEGQVIDHINHKPFDNRKENLRICIQQQNICNQVLKSNNANGFAGIYFDKSRNKWCVEIKCNYIKCFLGRYDKIEDACFVRLTAENKIFKEFRNTINDSKLIPIAEKSCRKIELETYVNKRISEKYSTAD